MPTNFAFKSDVIGELTQLIELLQNQNATRKEKVSTVNADEDIPWRLCMGGGWLDQPWVSKVMGGGVIVMNVAHHPRFKNRSGLATSSRSTVLKLWENGKVPSHLGNAEIAKLVFGAENPPGTKYGM